MPGSILRLRSYLDPIYDRYHRVEFLSSDPLEYVHRYTDPWDQEAVALIAALLAYGNVKQIRKSVEGVLDRMAECAGSSPANFVRSLEDPIKRHVAQKAFKSFVHRFNRGEDVLVLLLLLSRSWREHGSLGAHFVRDLEPGAENIQGALSALIVEWRSWAKEMKGVKPSFSYLLTSPSDGSCCKRWCMFLRWVGRCDSPHVEKGLDLGLWSEHGSMRKTFPTGRWLRADQLVLPLDTHTGRISQYLSLTNRKSLNWKAAVEATQSLKKKADLLDPTRFDFALSRLGILDQCRKSYRKEICDRCELLPVCRFARDKGVRPE